MKVTVIGTGYVGLVTGACLASAGHDVHCVDTNELRVGLLRRGEIPFYEPGLSDMVKQCLERGNISFYTKTSDAISKCDLCFIAVGTPQAYDGRAELKYVEQAARDIGKHADSDILAVTKSTVPVGTSDKVKQWIFDELAVRSATIKVVAASNPEFLKEGAAINDFIRPDRIIIGCDEPTATETLRELYASFNQKRDRIIVMDAKSAELAKYASNAMLASRISFMNEMASICEKTGANINQVRLGMGADERIGGSFLYSGCGFGGSCFPKDVAALAAIARDNDIKPQLLESVLSINANQKKLLFNKISEHFKGELTGKTFAIWGLAFKPNTDDIREAPALTLIEMLTERGANVAAADPQAGPNAKEYFKDNGYVKIIPDAYEALKHADALVHVTEWTQFRNPDFERAGRLLKSKLIFDGRNIYNRKRLEAQGFTLYQIGM